MQDGLWLCNIAIQLVLQHCCKTSCMFFVARFSVPLALSEIRKNNARLLLFNTHFFRSLRATSAREHFKVHAHILSGHYNLVNLSMSVVALRAYALNKCITMSPMCPPKQLQLLQTFRSLQRVCFVFSIEVPGEFDPSAFYKLSIIHKCKRIRRNFKETVPQSIIT